MSPIKKKSEPTQSHDIPPSMLDRVVLPGFIPCVDFLDVCAKISVNSRFPDRNVYFYYFVKGCDVFITSHGIEDGDFQDAHVWWDGRQFCLIDTPNKNEFHSSINDVMFEWVGRWRTNTPANFE